MAVGNLEFIKSASGTSVSSLSVTDCFSDKYDVYEVFIPTDDLSSTVDTRFRLLDSGGSEVTATSYDIATLTLRAGASFAEERLTSQDHFRSLTAGNNTTVGVGILLRIFNPYDSGSYTFSMWQSSFKQETLGYLEGRKSIGVLKQSAQHTGLSFYNGSGTLDSFSVSVYGVK